MTLDDQEFEEGGGPEAAPVRRIPEAVWINRPSALARRMRRAAKALGAAVVLGLAVLALLNSITGSLASSGGPAGPGAPAPTGPIGSFQAFDQWRLPAAEQPPTF